MWKIFHSFVNKKKHQFHEKTKKNSLKIHNCDPPPKKKQQQKFHTTTTTFWLLKIYLKKTNYSFWLKKARVHAFFFCVWVNFSLFFFSTLLQPFFVCFYFLCWMLKWKKKSNPCKLLEKQNSKWEKDFFFVF